MQLSYILIVFITREQLHLKRPKTALLVFSENAVGEGESGGTTFSLMAVNEHWKCVRGGGVALEVTTPPMPSSSLPEKTERVAFERIKKFVFVSQENHQQMDDTC